MRLRSYRQERTASTSRLGSAEEVTVEVPLEPEARTVMRMRLRYAGLVWICGRRGKSESQRTRSKRGSWLGRDSYGSADRRCESGLLWGGAERRRASLGGLKEIDRKNADQRLQRVAKAGLYGDEIVGNRQQQERQSEEAGGGDSGVQGKNKPEDPREGKEGKVENATGGGRPGNVIRMGSAGPEKVDAECGDGEEVSRMSGNVLLGRVSTRFGVVHFAEGVVASEFRRRHEGMVVPHLPAGGAGTVAEVHLDSAKLESQTH